MMVLKKPIWAAENLSRQIQKHLAFINQPDIISIQNAIIICGQIFSQYKSNTAKPLLFLDLPDDAYF